jgi:hypothetical protein
MRFRVGRTLSGSYFGPIYCWTQKSLGLTKTTPLWNGIADPKRSTVSTPTFFPATPKAIIVRNCSVDI